MSVDLSPELRRFAETPGRFTPIPEESSVKRFADDRVCIVQGPTWAAIADVRIEQDDIDSFIAEVRSLVPPENEPTWWIGPSTRPADLFDQLQRTRIS